MRNFTKWTMFMLLLLTYGAVKAQSFNVTFRVDMSQYQNLNDTVYVNGTWNSWCGRCNPLVKQGTTNVWQGTFSIPSGNHEFKYTIGGWNAQESLASGSPCTVTSGTFTNRKVTVTADTTMSLVCWNSCSACPTLQAMSLPINFDSSNVNYNLLDFGGNASSVVVDPTDSSNKVAKVIKTNSAQAWAGTSLGSGFNNSIPFASNATKMKIRVWSPDSGIVVKLKAEMSSDANKSVETDTRTTAANVWQDLEFDFTNQSSGTPAINFTFAYNKLSVFFNFGTTGAIAGEKTYYFDNVRMLPPSAPVLQTVKLPITFDSSNVNYVLADFGGNASSIVTDPTNSLNKVVKVIKTNTAQLWAGTTMNPSTGLAEAIPFVSGSTKLNVRVWSPDSGIAVRLKAEDPTDPTKSVETEARTKTAGSWEVLDFDFANQVTATAPINFTYTYKMLSIFFNFGTTGQTAGEKTYYFDDVKFGSGITPPPPVKVNVTFTVDVKNLPLTASDTVTINGTFNGWCGACAKMTKIPGTSSWTITIPLDKNTEYEYKYTIGNWVSQESLATTLPCTKTTGVNTNRVLNTLNSDINLAPVCWESCSACSGGAVTKSNVSFQVDMSKYNLSATDTVTLNGTFNGWCGNCTPMTKQGSSNIWMATVLLDKDSSYDFKYAIGNWKAQEILVEGSSCTRTAFGFTNRTFKVANKQQDTLPLVCWESCVTCDKTAPRSMVTFRVNMKDYVGDLSKGVTLNGSFNGWCGDCTPMTLVGNNIYEVKLRLDTGSYEFKYTIGNWVDDEKFNPGDPCTRTTGTFTNRFVRISDSSAVKVGAYCWNTCTICEVIGMEEQVLGGLSIYPNPASGMFTLSLPKESKMPLSIEIFNLLGSSVTKQSNLAAGKLEYALPIEGLEKGIYLVKVSMNQSVKTVKLVVE